MVCDRKKKTLQSVLKFPEESMIFIKNLYLSSSDVSSKNEEERKNTK